MTNAASQVSPEVVSVQTLPAVTPRRKPSPAGLARLLFSFRREVLWVAVFSFFANLLMLTPTLYMLQVYDRVLVSGSELTLLALTILTILFFGVMAFAEWVRSRLLVRASARLDEALSRRVFHASFEARLNATSSRSPLQPLTDLVTVRQYLTGNGAFAFFDLPWTLIYLAVLFVMHRWLGWAAVCFAIILGALALIGHRLTSKAQKKASDAVVDTLAFLYAKSRNAETVEALGMLGNLRRMWLHLHLRGLAEAADASERASRLQAMTKFVQYAQQSLILSVGALLVLKGEIGVGAMIASNALLANTLRPIGTLVATWRQFVDARQAYGRLDAVLSAHPERMPLRTVDSIEGRVSVQSLKADAPGRAQPILQDLTADFSPGEVVAIVGPSGAGKSTLARCLVGIWPDAKGQILIDGHPIDEWSREGLGPQIGYLPQDIEMLDGTIAENISRFGAVDSERVIDAAKRTGLHEMILRLPKGYDTAMGEAGAMLSGGQRQRVALARALYGDPRLVVLDEPNASLDDAGEAALIKAVRDLKSRGCTVFLIVHQPHMLAIADRALVLDQGRIRHLGPIVVQTKPATLEAKS